MSRRLSRCFVAMPFRPELNFVFLYIQYHLRERCGVEVERGDAELLTIPVVEKVRAQIARADLVIADVSGANPNVMYEVGIAHAMAKPVLFLTQDAPDTTPVDVRQFEFIVYDLGRHVEFLHKLEAAVRTHFGARYDELYTRALELLNEFNNAAGSRYVANTRDEFVDLVMRGERAAGIPSDPRLLDEFLVPKVVRDFPDPSVIRSYNAWITQRGSAA